MTDQHYELRQQTLQMLRNKYRNVTTRINRINHGETLANTDAEFATLIGRHLDTITARFGWTDTHRWISQANRTHAEKGLPGLLQLITSIASAV